MGPLLTVIAAIIFLGNAPTFWGWVGIGSILLAIVLLTLPVSTDESTAKDLRIKAGVVWGSLTGLKSATINLFKCTYRYPKCHVLLV